MLLRRDVILGGILSDDDLDGVMAECIVASELSARGYLSVKSGYWKHALHKYGSVPEEPWRLVPGSLLFYDFPTNPPEGCRIRVTLDPSYLASVASNGPLLVLDLPSASLGDGTVYDVIVVDHHGRGGRGYLEARLGNSIVVLETSGVADSTVDTLLELFDISESRYSYARQLAYCADAARHHCIRERDPVFLGYRVWRREPLIRRKLIEMCRENYEMAVKWLREESAKLVEWAEQYEKTHGCNISQPAVVEHEGFRGVAVPYYRTRIVEHYGYKCLTPCELIETLKLETLEYDVLLRFDSSQDRVGGLVVIESRGRWNHAAAAALFEAIRGALEAVGIRVSKKYTVTPLGDIRFGVNYPPSLDPREALRAILAAVASNTDR